MSQRLLSRYKQSKQLSLHVESSTHTLAEMRQQGSFLCLPNAWVHTQYGILDWHHPFTPYPRLMVSSFQAHTFITNAQKVFRCTKWKAAWSDAVTPGSSGVAYPKTKIAGWSSSICNHKIYTFKTEASAPPGATSGAIPTAQGCSAQGLGCSLAFMESLIQQQHPLASSTFFYPCVVRSLAWSKVWSQCEHPAAS